MNSRCKSESSVCSWMQSPDLVALFVAPLNSLGVDYMVTGAVAAILYGEPRLTNDIDNVVVLDIESVKVFRRAFDHPDFDVPPRSISQHSR